MNGLAALVFDVDGTLCETEEIHRAAFNQVFAAQGVGWHWTVADYARLLKVTGGKERMAAFRAERGEGPTDAGIARMHAEKTAAYAALVGAGGLVPRPGVLALIAAARAAGLRLAVATTTSPDNVEALCRAIWNRAADAVFDVVAAGDEVAAKKPAPDVYRLALARLGLGPDAAVAFEDSRNGVLAARAAGLHVIATPSLYSAGEDLSAATLVVPDLGQVTLDLARGLAG